MTYISWFIDIGLYLEDYLMYKEMTLAGGIGEPLLTCSSTLSFLTYKVPLLSTLYYFIIQVCLYGPIVMQQKSVP